jgi:hypothetical protein
MDWTALLAQFAPWLVEMLADATVRAVAQTLAALATVLLFARFLLRWMRATTTSAANASGSDAASRCGG